MLARTHLAVDFSDNRGVHAGRHVAARGVAARGVAARLAVVGHRYYGGTYYGHVRRYWHGRWYAYGVGSCWRLTPDGYYVWVCT